MRSAASDRRTPTDVPERAEALESAAREAVERLGREPQVIELLRLYAPALVPADLGEWTARDQGQPGLSVVTRTTGSRLELLRETLLCLVGQTCQDFESIVAVHNPGPGVLDAVRATVAEFDGLLGRSARVIEVNGGQRAMPIREGFRAASGWYGAVLDDDDLVMAHWVETLLRLAESRPGHVARVGAAIRRTAVVTSSDGMPTRVDTSGVIPSYVNHWDHWAHVAVNQTPIHAYAVPLRLTRELGLEWDADLPVVEDWQFLLRAGPALGVVEDLDVAAVYNRHPSGDLDTSYETVHSDVWAEVERQIRLTFEGTPAPIPPIDLTKGYRVHAVTASTSGARRRRLLPAKYVPVVEHYWRSEGAMGVARGFGRYTSRVVRKAVQRRTGGPA